MTDEQIKHMVDRFLGWRLPEDFHPDAGISFKATYNEHTCWPGKHQPSGTNLFHAGQAEAMIRHLIEGMPPSPDELAEMKAALDWCLENLSEDAKNQLAQAQRIIKRHPGLLEKITAKSNKVDS